VEKKSRPRDREVAALSWITGKSQPLHAILAQFQGPAPWTRSELERRLQPLIRKGGLPEPQANVLVAGEWVDFFSPGPRVGGRGRRL
jgi:hypothetical protein